MLYNLRQESYISGEGSMFKISLTKEKQSTEVKFKGMFAVKLYFYIALLH